MAAPARLLVTVPSSDRLRAEIERLLPGTAVEFDSGPASGPWPAVEAMLVVDPRRDLPGWNAPLTPHLRIVQRIFTGLDGFPFGMFPPEVQIAGNGGGYAPFVAEHAVALLLALSHNIPANLAQVRTGKLRPALPNRYLPGTTAVILGFGSIGRELARRLRALGMRVEAVSRNGGSDPDAERLYPAHELRSALAAADVVVECRPLTNSTRGTIDAQALDAMRPESSFINVGRAGTVDEAALFAHLQSHPGFRAAVDVWWDENFVAGAIGSRFPFADLPNFLGTPHIAGIGGAARDHAETAAVENLARFFRGESPRFVADPREYV